jgi:OmpA-OmpF porin, OOP family
MGKNKFKTLSLALLTSVMLLPTLESVADEGQYHLAIGGQRLAFDNPRQAPNDSSYTFGVGYGLSSNWDVELNYSKINLNTGAARQDLDKWGLDFIFTADSRIADRWTPYVVAGVGHNRFNDYRQTPFTAGLGLKMEIAQGIDWRTGIRSYYEFDDKTLDVGIETALVFKFGAPAQRSTVQPTPAPVAQPAAPAVVDSDGDGVPDDRDACPNTPRNHVVDERGCSIMTEEVQRIDLQVQFDFDRAEVKPEYLADIRRVADFLRANAGTIAALEGHTDSVGTSEYNQGLSERRVNAVRSVLVNEFGLESSRVTATGYGESRPVATNDTAEGRALNRRVVSIISATQQVPLTR